MPAEATWLQPALGLGRDADQWTTVAEATALMESRDAGLFNGVSIPLHGPRGETYVISLAAERATVPRPEKFPELQLLAAEFLIAYPRVALREADGPGTVRITPIASANA